MAHQKHVCRVIAKNYLTGIRENAIQTLVDMKMMEPKIESDLHEDVLPWLRQKIGKFEQDDGQAEKLAVSIIESGIMQAQLNHATTLRLRNERIAKEIADKEQSEKDRVKRRENRAMERELRDKRAAKAALRAQINKHNNMQWSTITFRNKSTTQAPLHSHRSGFFPTQRPMASTYPL